MLDAQTVEETHKITLFKSSKSIRMANFPKTRFPGTVVTGCVSVFLRMCERVSAHKVAFFVSTRIIRILKLPKIKFHGAWAMG